MNFNQFMQDAYCILFTHIIPFKFNNLTLSTMTSFLKLRFYQFLLIILACTLSNCVSDDYNLKDGVNTDMTIGGDSLTVPLGKTQKILLGKLLDDQNIDILKQSQSGAYLFQLKDSMQVNVNAISPVSFTIAPVSITPITTTLADVKIPSFPISPINITSGLPIPFVDLSSFSLPAINSAYDYNKSLSGAAGTKGLTNASGSAASRSKSIDPTVGPVEIQASQTIPQSMLFNLSNASSSLKKINFIQLNSSTVTIRFDKSKINAMGFSSQSDFIKSFSIKFPNEYIISSNSGAGTSIVGHEFRIDNAALSAVDVYVATFKIDKLDMTGIDQSLGLLSYSKDIPYTIDYVFSGTSADPTIVTKDINVNLSITSAPTMGDMEIQTTNFAVLVPSGSNSIDQTIQIPKEVSKVNTLTFDPGANLQLTISDPGISPFSFNAGNCFIQLPKKFIFKPLTGLDPTTNILTIPYNQLLGYNKNIGISGMTLNQSVPFGGTSILLHDDLSYNLVGLTVTGQTMTVSSINGMNNKKLNIAGNITGLTINNASVETNRIAFNIPSQSSNIDINQSVSKDVQKLYTLTLKSNSVLEFKIGISNLPTGIDSVFFDNYTIQLPTFLQFKAGDVNSQNQLVLNEGFKVKNGFTKDLTIQKIDFGANGINLTNGVLTLHDAVTMSGSAYVKGANLNSKDISSIVITPVVTIGTMTIGQIEGQISTNIQPVSQNVSLNLPSFLTGGASVFDIVNPVMNLEIGNTMGIPVSLDLTLTPKKNGTVITDGIIKTQVSIKPATVLGQPTWSRYWISNLCKGYSAGFDTINVALPKLLRSVPDQIEISAIPTITGNKQTVDLYALKNQMNLRYSVNVPLSFGKDFVLQYNDTISDLKKQLVEILKYARQVDMLVSIENSIPLELTLEATALNSSKGIIDGITISSLEKIKSGNANGTTQTSKIVIGLRESKTGTLGTSSTGALDLLDALRLKIYAKSNSTVSGIQLNPDQYITLELRARIPKGLTFNPSTTK